MFLQAALIRLAGSSKWGDVEGGTMWEEGTSRSRKVMGGEYVQNTSHTRI